jgi:protein subunit release factor A
VQQTKLTGDWQDRLTDHRIGFTVNGLRAIMEGDDLELVIGALKKDLEERRLESLLLDGDDIDY